MRRIIFAVCVTSCLLSAGCGSITNRENETSLTAAAEAITEATTETELITETSAEAAELTSITVPDPETQSGTDRDVPTIEQARELICALNMMERLAGGGLQYDAETVCTVNETAYYKVTDTDFANTKDIRCYEEKYLTQDMISERYSYIVDGDTPIYTDADDGLYMKDSAKGFYRFSDANPNIEKTFEEGYSILAEYDNFGKKETVDIRIVNVNGTWKICGISFGL